MTTGEKLAGECERRLGRIVVAAAIIELRYLRCPAGHLTALTSQSERIVLAMTETEFWLLELGGRLLGASVGAPLCCLNRQDVVARWHRRMLAWPAVWRAEFCWPDEAIYLECELTSCKEAERMMGLLALDELDRALRHRAPEPG